MRWFLRASVLPAAALALAVPVQAQNNIFGAKAGVSVASIDGIDDTFDDENTTGFAAGLFFTLGRGMLSLQPELNYTKKGFSYLAGVPGRVDVDLSYLQPAAVLKLGAPLGVVRPSVFAGVGYGFEVACSIEDVDCEDFELVSLQTNNDFSGIFGIDLEIGAGGVYVIGDARYEVGLSDIDDADDVFDDLKNRAWILRAGLGFRM